MEIGSFLSTKRKKLGLSLSDVGSILGYTPQAIYRYEKGIVHVDLSLVEPFCKALQLSINAFFSMDVDAPSSYSQEEKFREEEFRATLKESLSKDNSLSEKICSSLDISPSRLEKWAEGESLPSVEEFISLSTVLGYPPSNLYLGKTNVNSPVSLKPKKLSKRWLYLPLSTILGVTLLTAVIVPIALHEDSTEPLSSSRPSLKEYSVSIQGYDIEDNSKIDDLVYSFKVKEGEKIKEFSPVSPYYNFVKLALNCQDFDAKSTSIQSDLELVAYFEKKTFEVTFLGYENEVLSTSFTKYKSDATPPENVPDHGDFRFARWKESFRCVKKNLQIHSLFTRFRGSLSLDFDGGEADGETSKLIEGYTSSDFSSLPIPHKKGHEFISYVDSNGNEFNASTPLEEEVTSLKATYRPLQYILSLGEYSSLSVTYGEEVSSLPPKLNERIVIGWKKGEEEITLPFVYEDDCDLTLEPLFADDYFDYEFDNGSLLLKRVLRWEKSDLNLSSIGEYPIRKIASHALSDLPSLRSLRFEQVILTLETSCFENLPSLQKVEFPFLTSASRFDSNIFSNCPNVQYLLTGTPSKTSLEPLKLKEYGLEGNENFTLELNDASKELPLSWNEDFGTIGEFRMGNGLEGLDETRLVTKGSKVLRFVPGEKSYVSLRLELPDINQDEMRFHGLSLIKIVGEKFGTVKRFKLHSGAVSVSDRTMPLMVHEFDASEAILFPMRTQKVLADRVLLSDRASEGYFAPLHETLEVHIYGAKEIPSALLNNSCFVDLSHTDITCHSEKHYDANEILDYSPEAMAKW